MSESVTCVVNAAILNAYFHNLWKKGDINKVNVLHTFNKQLLMAYIP